MWFVSEYHPAHSCDMLVENLRHVGASGTLVPLYYLDIKIREQFPKFTGFGNTHYNISLYSSTRFRYEHLGRILNEELWSQYDLNVDTRHLQSFIFHTRRSTLSSVFHNT